MTLTDALYRAARLRRDLRAAQRGPEALGRRLIRRAVYRRVNGATARILRRAGL